MAVPLEDAKRMAEPVIWRSVEGLASFICAGPLTDIASRGCSVLVLAILSLSDCLSMI